MLLAGHGHGQTKQDQQHLFPQLQCDVMLTSSHSFPSLSLCTSIAISLASEKPLCSNVNGYDDA